MQQDSEDALLNLDSDDQKKQQQIEAELAADRAKLKEDEATPSVYDTLTKHFVSVDWPGWKAYRLEVSADVISYFM